MSEHLTWVEMTGENSMQAIIELRFGRMNRIQINRQRVKETFQEWGNMQRHTLRYGIFLG